MRVIKKVTEPYEWENSLVVVEKPNKSVGLCSDPRGLNKSILREHFPMKQWKKSQPKLRMRKSWR